MYNTLSSGDTMIYTMNINKPTTIKTIKQRKKLTYSKSAEYIFNSAMVYGSNVKTDNKYILTAKEHYSNDDIYDEVDRELVFKLFFEYFKNKNKNHLTIADTYEMERDGMYECKYWKLVFNKNTDKKLVDMLKAYYSFLRKITEQDIKNIKNKYAEHDYQKELLDKLLNC